MNKLGLFLTGAVVGAVGLGLTACLVEGFPSSSRYDDTDNDDAANDETNDNADATDTFSIFKTTEENEAASAYTETNTSEETKQQEQSVATVNNSEETITKLTEVLSELVQKLPKEQVANS